MTAVRAASTVVVLRDADHGLEVLLLQRSAQADFMPGHWVFPGGGVEPGDAERAGGDPLLAARLAAAREALEETALALDAAQLRAISRWTAPVEAPKRYDTLFFAARVPAGEVVVDGREIVDFAWLAPVEILAARQAGRMALMPPTFVTLEWLAAHSSVESALLAAQSAPVPHYQPRLASVDGGVVFLYEGDAGYASGNPAAGGPRHRFWMLPAQWRYERDPD